MAWLIDGAYGGSNFVLMKLEPPTKPGAFAEIGKVPKAEVIRSKGRLDNNRTNLPNAWYTQNRWIVDETVKSIIEAHEPKIHAFYPIEIVTKKGNAVLGRSFFSAYFVGLIDCVVASASDVSITAYPDGGKTYSLKGAKPRLFAEAAAVSGRHAFHAAHMVVSLVFSDTLASALNSANVKGFEMRPIKEI